MNTTLWEDDEAVIKDFVQTSAQLKIGIKTSMSNEHKLILVSKLEECMKQFIKQQHAHWTTADAMSKIGS